MRESCIVRLFRDDDGKRMNLLYNAVFKKHRALEVWKWKFSENPVETENVISVAEKGKNIVGMYPSWTRCHKFNNEFIYAVQPVENCVHPDYRNAILFKKLHKEYRRRCIELGVPFAFGFPTELHFKLGQRIFGYKNPFTIPVLIKRLNLRLACRARLPNRFLERMVFLISNKFYKILFSLSLTKISKDYHMERVDTFDEGFDRFWKKISHLYNIIGVRSSIYLNWRYIFKTDGGYTIFRCIKNGEVHGYIVLKISDECLNERIGLILDFLGEDDNAVSELLNRARSYFLSEKVDYMKTAMLENTLMYAELMKRGFKKHTGLQFVYELFEKRIDSRFMDDKRNWFFTYGDSDLVD